MHYSIRINALNVSKKHCKSYNENIAQTTTRKHEHTMKIIVRRINNFRVNHYGILQRLINSIFFTFRIFLKNSILRPKTSMIE